MRWSAPPCVSPRWWATEAGRRAVFFPGCPGRSPHNDHRGSHMELGGLAVPRRGPGTAIVTAEKRPGVVEKGVNGADA